MSYEPSKDPNAPDWTPPAYADAAEVWADCRAVAGGTRSVRAAGVRYLPMNPAETRDDYLDRLTRTELFNGFARTIDAMTGLVFQRDPELRDADEQTLAEWENVDGAGTHGAVFLRRVYADGLTTGRAGILVEHPSAPAGLSVAEEQARNLRPYWLAVRAEDVLSWRTTRVGAETVFTQLVLRECTEAPVGAFGAAEVTRYRVYRRAVVDGRPVVSFEVWEHPDNDGKKRPTKTSEGVLRGVQGIPFAPFCPASDGEVWGGKPPLVDLLDVNLAHYAVTGDRRHTLHLVCAPIPVRTGASATEKEAGEVALGSTRLLDIPAGGTFAWVSPAADFDAPTAAELKMLEGRMAALGLSMLQHETRDAETAEGARIHRAGQNATLAGTARTLQDCAERAAQFHAAYAGRAPAGVSVNTDFEQIVLAPEQVASYSAMVTAGQLSLDTLWAILSRGHVLPDDFDPETERARIQNAQPAPLLDGAGDGVPPDGAQPDAPPAEPQADGGNDAEAAK